MKKTYSQNGYTLLFAVLTATLVLGVTVFILSVSRKQFFLSSTARDSMFALYAADAGIECMAADPTKNDTAVGSSNTVTCSNRTVTKTFTPYPSYYDEEGNLHSEATQAEFDFGFMTEEGNPNKVYGCAKIKVIGYMATPSGTPVAETVFESQGYNVCTYTAGSPGTYAPDTSTSRTVERAMRVE